MKKIFFVILAFFLAAPALAHEVRPAYLELKEEEAGEFSVLWKTPMRGETRLSLSPEFSGENEELTPVVTRRLDNAAVQTWRFKAGEPLRGGSVRIVGLEGTMTDALVRINFADDTLWTGRLTPQEPAVVIPVSLSALQTAVVYLKLGIEHILMGIDHLLFILSLLIITRGGWNLVKTVTAFTVSHSVTLTAATLGWVHVPQRPVEAVIALSIVFVALEIVQGYRGRASIAAQAPWAVAFSFGLLHGLGFAGGLSEAGLPANHIPTALLFFSCGVETGHLLFVATVLSFITAARRTRISFPYWVKFVPPYAIGGVAMFWVIQRVLAF